MTLDDTLEYCLTEIHTGRKTIAECVALFPELKAELGAALALQDLRSISLRPEAERLVDARLRQTLAGRSRRPQTLLRWAVASLIALFILFSVSTSTLAAASVAVPGDTLYGVKRAVETVQLSLTPTGDRAALLTTLAQRRLDELSDLVGRGDADPSTLVSLITDLATTTEAAIAAAEQVPTTQQSEVFQAIIHETRQQQTILHEITAGALPQTQAQIQVAISAAAQIQDQALDRLGMVDPAAQATLMPTAHPTATLVHITNTTATATPATNANLAPGQAKKTAVGPASSDLPLTPEPTLPPVIPARMPPGQSQPTGYSPTAPMAGLSTAASPNARNGQCHGNNPNCVTPSPDASIVTPIATLMSAPGEAASPTLCPTNPGGHPKCKP